MRTQSSLPRVADESPRSAFIKLEKLGGLWPAVANMNEMTRTKYKAASQSIQRLRDGQLRTSNGELEGQPQPESEPIWDVLVHRRLTFDMSGERRRAAEGR
jgi:hypothetical protein